MWLTAEALAAQLARAVDLFRDPAKKEDQKQAFRTLVTMLQQQDVTVRAVGGRLWVNSAPVDGPQLEALVRRLELHGVTEITIPQDAPVSQVFVLLRALAEQPGWSEDIDARLHGSGISRISVSMARLTDPPPEEPPPPAPPAGGAALVPHTPLIPASPSSPALAIPSPPPPRPSPPPSPPAPAAAPRR